MSKGKSGLKLPAITAEDGVNMLINAAIGMHVKNTHLLVADGYPGRKLSMALAEINRASDERFSRIMSLEMQKVSQLIGDPQINTTTSGKWGPEETRYLSILRERIRRSRARTKPSTAGEASGDGEASEQIADAA